LTCTPLATKDQRAKGLVLNQFCNGGDGDAGDGGGGSDESAEDLQIAVPSWVQRH